MKLADRLRLLFQAMLNDLFGEDTGLSPAGPGKPSQEALFEEIQALLARLQISLAEADSRQKRVEFECQQTQEQFQALDAQVDAALRSGQEDEARAKLELLQRIQSRIKTLEERRLSGEQAVNQLRDEVHRLQGELAEARHKASTLAERERSAEAREELVLAQRELYRKTAALRQALDERAEQLARQEDRLAARQELNERRNANKR